jgi:hypothetical protein
MGDPIPLVLTGESELDLYLDEKALEVLASEKRPVTVISIVGPYRSGKSYLMNCLMNKSNSFPLGHKTISATKGFWFWKGDFPGNSERCFLNLTVVWSTVLVISRILNPDPYFDPKS